MKLSRKFVSDYIDLDDNLSITDIADAMTSVGNEYDSAGPLVDCTNLVTGEIIECNPHPDSDHLKCCKVNIGSEILDIVCGAPNARTGIKVIVALDGAHLPGGEIKKGMIRGCTSNGMLCSKAELGLDNKYLKEEDHTGIHELPLDTPLGLKALEVLGLDDEVIDFELTSNRGDLLSILGMSYEFGAIYNKQVKEMDTKYTSNNESISDEFEVKLNTDDCKFFLAKKVKNVVIKESPDFIKNRLIASGIRPINNVVDISNYVMLETGQPLHYYDADSLGDTLIVRNASNGEIIKTLDGIDRNLSESDIVIANGNNEAVGLAGVMGGLSTEVEQNTKNIIIEAAIFDAVKIRKTSKKILRSEASNRFEKGLDPKRTYLAIERSAALLERYADATVVGGLIEEKYIDIEDKVINITPTKIEKVLGIKISNEEIVSIFNRLGFIVKENNDSFEVTVPTRRIDISIEEDLIEEVGRIYGMDKIEGKLPVLDCVRGSYDATKRAIKHKLADMGLNETMSYTLIPNGEVKKFTTDEFIPVTLNDPMSEDRNTLRYSLLYSLFDIYNYNKARNNSNISIFELGKGFYKENDTYKEDLKLSILMSGEYNLGITNEKVDFYTIKGILEELLYFLGYEGRYSLVKENLPNELHPHASALINVNGNVVGIIGKIHPSVTKDDIYVLEINLDKLLSIRTGSMKFKEISKFPAIVKDVAFIVDNDVTSLELMTAIKKSAGKLLTNISIFDLYKNIEDNKKSMAYKLTFEDPTKTLVDEEVMEIFNKIITDIESKFNAKLRG